MNTDLLAQEAVKAALCGDWKKAIEVNGDILKKTPVDLDALNRLSKAFAELGKVEKAKTLAKKVLKLDHFNSIAKKSLEKWKSLGNEDIYSIAPSKAQIFLEEPGKTKIISLLHLGDTKVVASLDCGDEVKMSHHSHRVSIFTMDGKYIGKLPDDLSARLRYLITGGNAYQVFIKSVDKKEVKVIIQEVVRSKKLSEVPSFPPEKIDYVSFTPPEFVHKKEELAIETDTDEE